MKRAIIFSVFALFFQTNSAFCLASQAGDVSDEFIIETIINEFGLSDALDDQIEDKNPEQSGSEVGHGVDQDQGKAKEKAQADGLVKAARVAARNCTGGQSASTSCPPVPDCPKSGKKYDCSVTCTWKCS